jgi:hypothetical protein
MPIKSQAQRRKFAELLVEGKIKPEVYERWNREAGDAHLPERVTPNAKKKKKKKKKRKTTVKRGARAKPRKRKA